MKAYALLVLLVIVALLLAVVGCVDKTELLIDNTKQQSTENKEGSVAHEEASAQETIDQEAVETEIVEEATDVDDVEEDIPLTSEEDDYGDII